jgi:hypothetical protein
MSPKSIKQPLVILLLLLFLVSCLRWQKNTRTAENVEWEIADFLTNKSADVRINGNPQVIDSPYGNAVYFDGIEDAIFLTEMPLKSMSEFTVEMIFCPDSNASFEQRVLHIGEIKEDRMLLEIRAVGDCWYFDGFAASGENKLALLDEHLTHPLGVWYHVAFVVEPNRLTTYVNGAQELQEQYTFTGIDTGTTSIGVRLNSVSWFKGTIYKIRITPQALNSEDFLMIKP